MTAKKNCIKYKQKQVLLMKEQGLKIKCLEIIESDSFKRSINRDVLGILITGEKKKEMKKVTFTIRKHISL
jgi:hypothetical protein